jgi:mono/diheme cytochrome c family protein
VSAGTVQTKVGRRLAAVVPLLFGVALVSGCDPDPYPDDLEYPLRTDLLVKKVEGSNIDHAEPLGTLDQAIASLKNNDKAETLDPADLPDEKRDQLAAQLKEAFGTPADPAVPARGKEGKDAVKKLLIDEETLARGSVLYRRHCVHCHGLTGDGRGPTAAWVNPHPRDYRRGIFKFTSVVTSGTSKPRRADLLRTLREGVEGTSMPAFRQLPDEELNDLASYVIHLSIRGLVEFEVMQEILTALKGAKGEEARDAAMKDIKVPALVKRQTTDILGQWVTSEARPIEVPVYPFKDEELKESVRRGFNLFLGAGACINCHTDYGRQAGYRYDAWGTLVRPANLTAGVYRGGRRPLDLYYRISNGIPPSDMPAAAFGGDAHSNPENGKKMWDLVNFVRALPYPAMLPDDVRERIYGTKKD